jgi:cyclase
VLKTRVVGVVAIKDGVVVQSVGFQRFLPVGRASIAIEYLNRWGIDEIALLDIRATHEDRRPDMMLAGELSKEAQVPFAVGGGIRDLHDVEGLIRSGADKVVINTAALARPALINEAARLFGKQCVIVSIDASDVGAGRYEAFSHGGARRTGREVTEVARVAEQHGAGEIFLTSIARDGSKLGYDLDLARQVIGAVRLPVILCGGVGRAEHFVEGMAVGASAVAAANFFHYTEHSVAVAKRFIRNAGGSVRLDTLVSYQDHRFSTDGRLAKVDDAVLDGLRFRHIPEDVI